MTLASPSGVLGFTCELAATGTELVYLLGGTDAAAFSLSVGTAALAVTKVAAGVAIESPDMTVASVTEGTTASSMALTGLCPAVGQGWMFFGPKAVHVDHADHVEGEVETPSATKD